MKIPLATDLKTRVGDTTKDARLKNAYVEVRGEQSVVRHRPSARGGVAVGSGVAQGGYGNVLFWGDTAYTISDSTGTTWAAGTSYSIGDHVSYEFVDYWALTDHSGSQPPSSNWSTSYVSEVPFTGTYATLTSINDANLSGGNLIASFISGASGCARSNISKTSGKWYFEITITTFDQATAKIGIGILSNSIVGGLLGNDSGGYGYSYIADYLFGGGGKKLHSASYAAYASNYTQGDIIGVAMDADTDSVTFYKNGTSNGVAFTGISSSQMWAALSVGSISPSDPINVLTVNFGASAFSYSVPSGYNRGLYTP